MSIKNSIMSKLFWKCNYNLWKNSSFSIIFIILFVPIISKNAVNFLSLSLKITNMVQHSIGNHTLNRKLSNFFITFWV